MPLGGQPDVAQQWQLSRRADQHDQRARLILAGAGEDGEARLVQQLGSARMQLAGVAEYPCGRGGPRRDGHDARGLHARTTILRAVRFR